MAQTSAVLLGKAGRGHNGECRRARGSLPSPTHSQLGYSHLGRQQKTSDNWWAPGGPRAAKSLMWPPLSENYIYKADAAQMRETRVPDRGVPAPAESFIHRRQQLNCDATQTHEIKIQHICSHFTSVLSPLLFSSSSVSNWDEICCLLCVSQRFKINRNNLCAVPQAIFLLFHLFNCFYWFLRDGPMTQGHMLLCR